jgi:drug/metabolite transporter (DMT)-like permease
MATVKNEGNRQRTRGKINFVPIFAIMLGYVLLEEPVMISLLGGGVLVISGVYLTNRRSRR